MSFLPSLLHSSIFWWFLPLAAIPLVLHLLTLHRLKTVELSTFRFLFDSYVQQRRRMQFLEALLAALRTAFLFFLIWMFSRPIVKNWNQLFGAGGAGGGREVVLLVDCSASMNASHAGIPAIERARKAALAVAGRLGRDDRVTLIRLTAAPEEVFSRFSTDAKEIQEKIEGLKTTSSRANVFAALLQLFGPEAQRRTNPVVYLFTDSQSSGWREVRNQGLDRLIPAGTPFYVVNVGPKEPLPNRAVVGDAPRRNRAIAGLPFSLTARVVNYSKSESSDVTLSVFIDEKEVARTPLTLKPGETLTRKIDYVPREPGIQRGRFEITGKTSDSFPDDDRYFFVLNVEPRVRVLLVNGHPAADPVDNEARYLYTALTSRAETAPAGPLTPDPSPPGGERGGKLAEASKEILRSLDVREVPEPMLTAETLRDASVVVLANCGALNAQQFDWLRNFVNTGGGLLIFPGDRVARDTYNTQFFPVPGPQGQRLTAATLGQPEGDPEKLETFEQFASLNYDHPVLSVFGNPDSDSPHFKTVRVYKRYKLALPPVKANEKSSTWPLIRFSDGSPALVESRLGDGGVILAAFPAHARWTNLPTKPDFVPLVLRLVSHLEHKPEADVSSVVVADGAAEITAVPSWDPAETAIKDPAGHSFSKHLERNGARLVVPFDQTSARGYYTVDVRGEHRDQPRAASLAFAVNLAPEESDFTVVGENDLKTLLPGAKLEFVDASAEAQLEKGALGSEKEVWPILIWIVFGVIGIEFLLATAHGRRAEGEEQAGVGERIRNLSPGAWVGRMTGAGRQDSPQV
jgi:hypothetical protein